jgi:hydrogenase maturation protein HypF
VALISGQTLLISGDLGNLDTPHAVAALEATARQMVAQADAPPCAIAHDLHPDFPSSRLAALLAAEWGIPTCPVQHHAAHMGALMVDHPAQALALSNGRGQVLGLALDGFGLGPDKASWGGEMIALNGRGQWHRPGGLALLAQPGGDVAARQPWRMGAAALHRLGLFDQAQARYGALVASTCPELGGKALPLIGQMLDRNLNSPKTSSCGRLFDAVCGLLGVVPMATFEGEAPMALEKMAQAPQLLADGWRVEPDGTLCLDPLLAALADLSTGQPCQSLSPARQEQGANLFHGTLAAALVDWVVQQAASLDQPPLAVPLGGGCFFNRVLSAAVCTGLSAAGLTPLSPTTLSAGDPAISAGQAWIAAGLAADRG